MRLRIAAISLLLAGVVHAQQSPWPFALDTSATLLPDVNFQGTYLALPVTAGQTTLLLTSAVGLVVNEQLFIDFETVKVLAINGLSITVQRGFDKSIPVVHAQFAHLYRSPGAWLHNATTSSIEQMQLWPLWVGATLPSTCQVGQLFYVSTATAGGNIFGCTTLNTWTQEGGTGGGGGGGGITGIGILNNSGTLIGTEPNLQLFNGNSNLITWTLTDAAGAVTIQPILDTSQIALLNATQTWLAGFKNSYSASATTAPLNFLGRALPTSPATGDWTFDTTNTPNWYDGSAWRKAVYAVSTLTNGAPVIGNGSNGLSSGTTTGNGGTFLTGSGTYTPGDCLVVDGSLNIVDNLHPCGPTATVNDTNIQGTISGNTLTFSWASLLPKNRNLATAVYTDQANTYSSFLQNFASATLKVPSGAGLAPTTSGLIGYDTTLNSLVAGINGVTGDIPFYTGTPTGCAQWNGTSLIGTGAGCTNGTGVSGTGAPTWSPITDGTCQTQAFTVPGMVAGTTISPGLPAGFQPGLSATMWSAATNNVSIQICNLSGGPLTPSGTFTAMSGAGSGGGGGGGGITSLNALTVGSQVFGNDTNVTIVSSSATHQLTWVGTLAKGRTLGTTVYTDQTNVFGAFLQNLTSSTLKVPNSAGAAPTTNALLAYDTTANLFVGGLSGAKVSFPFFSGAAPAAGNCVQWGSNGLLTTTGVACGTGGGGSSAWSALTTGTNTTAGGFFIGNGASLAASGTGTITATAMNGTGPFQLTGGTGTAPSVSGGQLGLWFDSTNLTLNEIDTSNNTSSMVRLLSNGVSTNCATGWIDGFALIGGVPHCDTTNTITNTGTSGTQVGLNFTYTANPAATSTASYQGWGNEVQVQAGNTQNLTGATLFGLFNNVDHFGSGTVGSAYGSQSKVNNRSTGTISLATAVYAVVQNSGAGTITQGFGLNVAPPLNSGGGTFGTYYAAFLDDPGAAVIGTKYGLYSASATSTNFLAGKTGVNISAPVYQFQVAGKIGLTNSGTTTLAACGTAPSILGNDSGAVVTIGTGTVTSCTVTFSAAFAASPICTASDNSNFSLIKPTPSTTQLVLATNATTIGGDQISYVCIGK